MPGLTDDERVKMAGQIGDPMAEKKSTIFDYGQSTAFSISRRFTPLQK